jgi:short-subunit dehydrogenase
MSDLNEAVVVITGAAGGFGKEFTKQLLQAGSRLILNDLEPVILHEQAQKISSQIKTGDILTIIASDLSSRSGSEYLYEQVKALNLHVDILINNAGIGLFGRMDEVPSQKWEQLMQVNLLAPMALSSLFMADMIARRKGHIVNISSVAGWSAPAGLAHYSASKFGLRGFSEGLREELKPYNVKVTTVYPFFSRTPILQSQRYGTLAQEIEGFPENMATNPVDIIRATLQGIVQNKIEVFPDRPAKTIHLLKRYFPQLLPWLSDNLANKMRKNPFYGNN